jgi:hypothetical protein
MSIIYDAAPTFDLEFSASATPQAADGIDTSAVWQSAQRLVIECACYGVAGLVAVLALAAMAG